MSASITCSKKGCGKSYIGKDFESIQIEHDLVRQGPFYFCRSCYIKASGKELKVIKKLTEKGKNSDNIGVEELYRNEGE